ncbi:MAG TPA: DUF4232 domain-containing protein [Micromonosporaceae bacterium]|nr:DUF4232 domain-containing protein [Micromonosporaceae bacterium]
MSMSIEDQIRASLTDDSRALPGWPDATERVHRGMRRRRRQRAAAVAFGVTLVLAVPFAVAAYLTNSAGGPLPTGTRSPSTAPRPSGPASPAPSSTDLSESAVPWIDAPATYRPNPTGPVPTARPCTTADLSTTAGWQDHLGISQQDAANVMVKNISRSRCTLSGTPELVSSVSGRYKPVATTKIAPVGGATDVPASINPQDDAYVQVAMTLACNGGTGPTRYAEKLALMVGGTPIPVTGLKLSGTCPEITITPWFTFRPDAVSPYEALVGQIEAPSSVERGETLSYAVDITNTSDVAVPLNPCPVYWEAIVKQFVTYRLNCAPGAIAPGQTVRFSMQIALPADLPTGATTLMWRILDVDFQAACEKQIVVTG